MSEFGRGILVLAMTDLVLFAGGTMVYRSRGMGAHAGLSPWLALGLAAGAFSMHFLGLYFAAALIRDRFTVLVLTCLFGLPPAVVFALLLRDTVADRAINIIMGSRDAGEKLDLTAARQFAVRGELEHARNAYQVASRAFPGSPEPLFGLESIYVLERRYEEAADVCRSVLRKFADDAQVRVRACQRLAELLEQHLDDSEGARTARAMIDDAAAQGWQPIKGAREQRAAAKLGVVPTADRFTLEAARALVRQGDTDGGVNSYKRFFELHPEHPRPLFEAATALESAGRFREALEVLQIVMKRFPESPEHWGASALRQASVHEHRLEDPETARRVLLAIQDRLPGTEIAQVATERLSSMPKTG